MLKTMLNKIGSAKTQKIMFSFVLALSLLAIIFTTVSIQKDNTQDEDICYAEALVNSVSTYSETDPNGNISEHYNVRLSFSIQNENYNDILVYDTVSAEIGDTVTIKYHEGSPELCEIVPPQTFDFGLFALYFFFAFLSVGSIAVIAFISKHERIERHNEIRQQIEEQHQKDEEEISFAKREYYQTEPNPFDNSDKYNSTDIYTGDDNPFDDKTDYSQQYNRYEVTDSFCDAESSYTGYENQDNGDGFDGARSDPFSDNNDYSNTMPNGGLDSYADPFAPYSGYDDKK